MSEYPTHSDWEKAVEKEILSAGIEPENVKAVLGTLRVVKPYKEYLFKKPSGEEFRVYLQPQGRQPLFRFKY